MGSLPVRHEILERRDGVVRFKLNAGLIGVIDEQDMDLLIGRRWSARPGARPYLGRRRHPGRDQLEMDLLHRVVARRVLPIPDGYDVDHINGNVLDNRRENLRAVSRAVNMRNYSGLRPNNTSGVSGVSYDKSRGKWCAKIRVDMRQVHLGRFDTLEDAKRARLDGERRLWGIEPRRAELHQ